MTESKTPKSDQIRALREKAHAERAQPRVVTTGAPFTALWPAVKSHVEDLQRLAEEVKAKKRGRPATRTPEERKAFRAELMRKRRADRLCYCPPDECQSPDRDWCEVRIAREATQKKD